MYSDADVYDVLTRNGNDYLPDEVIDGGFIVDEFANIDISDINGDVVTGTCSINCHQEEKNEEDVDVSFNAEFEVNMDSGVIKFSNVLMDDYL